MPFFLEEKNEHIISKRIELLRITTTIVRKSLSDIQKYIGHTL